MFLRYLSAYVRKLRSEAGGVRSCRRRTQRAGNNATSGPQQAAESLEKRWLLASAAVNLEVHELPGDPTPGVIAVGEEIDVQFHVRDTVNNQAVFAGYADFGFDPNHLQVVSVTHDADYANGVTGTVDNVAGIVDELGGSDGLTVPADTLVATVRLRAVSAGRSVITTDAGEAPTSQIVSHATNNPGDLRGDTDYGSVEIISTELDLDSNGMADAATDGILAIRYMFSFRGDALIGGAIGVDANNTTAPQVETALDQAGGMLDADGNGLHDAATDGILILRYLFGFRDATLVSEAVGPAATRTTGAEVAAFLNEFVPTPPPPPPGAMAGNATPVVNPMPPPPQADSDIFAVPAVDRKPHNLFAADVSTPPLTRTPSKDVEADAVSRYDGEFATRLDWLSVL